MTTQASIDTHAQIRALYHALLTTQGRFEEFKHLLSLYDVDPAHAESESPEAAATREKLNDRIRDWTGGPFDGLSVAQMIQWRGIVVDERFNVQISPWKESNNY